jgi:hypothetical protein
MTSKPFSPVDFAALVMTADVSAQKRFNRNLIGIEEAFAKGVQHQAILDHLNANGFDLTIETYRVMLKRARQRNARELIGTVGAASGKSPAAPTPPPQANAPATSTVSSPAPASHKVLNHDLNNLPAW